MIQAKDRRCRCRNAKAGRICRTLSRLSADEAAKYPDAKRIQRAKLVRDMDEDQCVMHVSAVLHGLGD